MTNPIEQTIVASMQAEIERLQAELAEVETERDDARANNAILRNQLANPVEQYIQIQDYQNRSWHTLSQRFAMTETQQGFVELEKWRTRFPASKFRLVSVAVTFLAGEQENG